MEAVKSITADRTQKAVALIEKLGGKVKEMYVLLGEHDLVLIVDFPDLKDAVKASIQLAKLTNIAFTTAPAVTVQDFDKLAA